MGTIQKAKELAYNLPMNVFVVKFSKQDLLQLSSSERTLVLQLGHVCNELVFLNKLLLIVSDLEREGVERTAATTQSMIVVRLFIGKVFEAWLMLGKEYLGTDLRAEFDPLLSDDVVQSLAELKWLVRKTCFHKFETSFRFTI